MSAMLVIVGIFIYLAAMAELQANALRWFARDFTVTEGMEQTVRSLPESALLSEAVEALLASSQRAFPVINAMQKPVGLLDRDDLVLGIKEKGPEAAVTSVMRKPNVISSEVPLNDAITGMSRDGVRSQVVVDAGGRLVGMLTLENIAEMMIHSIRPEWKFLNQRK